MGIALAFMGVVASAAMTSFHPGSAIPMACILLALTIGSASIVCIFSREETRK
jgi:hypothetical protein